MFKFKKTDVSRELRDKLQKAGDQVPYATSLALNELAYKGREAMKSHFASVLNAPIPFTLRGVLYEKATKTDLRAYIYLRDEVAEYISPNISGGDRDFKGLETGLKARRLFGGRGIPSDSYFIAARGFQSGPRGRITKAKARNILNETKKKDGKFFLFKDDKDGRLYVFERGRSANDVKLALIGVNKPRYKQRVDFQGTIERLVAQTFETALSNALDKALPPSDK